MKDTLWVEKYRPTRISEVMGNEQAKATYIEWLKSKHRRKKAALLYGPPGVGKTALVNAASNEFGFRIVEMNASDTRTESAINKVASPATLHITLDNFTIESKGKLLFLDEVDGVFGNQDRGGIGAIVEIVEKSQIPVVLAANDSELQKLRPLKKVCELIRFQQVRIPLIILMLRKICIIELIDAEFEALERIAENSQGDLRSAINDLQRVAGERGVLRLQDTLALSARNKDENMYETLKGAFSAKSYAKAISSLNRANVDHNELLLSISDNLPNRYSDLTELGKAYDLVSRADIFSSRIATENWHLLRYLYNFLAEAVTVAPKSFRPFEFITLPIRVITLFWTKGKRMKLENICTKIGLKCHVSINVAKQDIIPYVKAILQENKSSPVADWFKLEPEEVNYILNMNRI